MLDWLGKMIGLPPQFLSRSPGSRGGGVIQTSASECVLDCLLAARAQAIRALKLKMGDKVEETVLLSKLMAYCSKVNLVYFSLSLHLIHYYDRRHSFISHVSLSGEYSLYLYQK